MSSKRGQMWRYHLHERYDRATGLLTISRFLQVPEEYTGAVVDLLSRRKGEMTNMAPADGGGDKQMTNIEYIVPTRGMIGLRNGMLTATRGTAVMDTIFNSYKPYAGLREFFPLHVTLDNASADDVPRLWNTSFLRLILFRQPHVPEE